MGRPPCCDKTGVKKGPWTPEEDIMLVSYVQERGPGNWRTVPTNTGLRRCSKSCRLRWTNYLRPGIRRGNFTDQEEKMIIQVQALLGNKWAAIASYLPERTDNDIKNYWNTHLKKKLKKSKANSECQSRNNGFTSIAKGQWERKLQTDINIAKEDSHDAISVEKPSFNINTIEKEQSNEYNYYTSTITTKSNQTSTYASSTENIARLLKGWMKKYPNCAHEKPKSSSSTQHSFNINTNALNDCSYTSSTEGTPCDESKINSGIDLSEAFEPLYGFESFETSTSAFSQSTSPEATSLFQGESKLDYNSHLPLSTLENWLLDENTAEAEEDLAYFSFDENNDLF